MLLVVELQRGVERTAGDEIASGAGIELGVQRRVVFGRRGRREHDLDARVLGFESRDQFFLPDGQVVVAPAFDGQRDVFCMGKPGGAENAGCQKQSF